jgi:hypothetical protein
MPGFRSGNLRRSALSRCQGSRCTRSRVRLRWDLPDNHCKSLWKGDLVLLERGARASRWWRRLGCRFVADCETLTLPTRLEAACYDLTEATEVRWSPTNVCASSVVG